VSTEPSLPPLVVSRLWKKAQKLLEALCKKGEILEWHGHCENGELFYRGYGTPKDRHKAIQDHLRGMISEVMLFHLRGEAEQAVLVRAFEEGALLDEPLILNTMRSFQCPSCGTHMRMGFNGQGFVVLADPCPYPTGLVTEWELNVPSGKLAVANDLRRWFPSDGDYDINNSMGTHLTTLAYANVGMSHGFVGNTCPSIYRDGDHFVIGSYQEKLWDDETDEERDNPELCPWGDSVASVCTDLWWFSIVDFDEFLRRVPHYTPEEKIEGLLGEVRDEEGCEVPLSGRMLSGGELVVRDRRLTVVDVRPGVYKFRQEQGVDRDAALVKFATFEWVREPDEVRDFLKEEREKTRTATEVLIDKCLSWPSLYMGVSTLDPRERDRKYAVALWEKKTLAEKTVTLAHAANHLMCTGGNGIDWHENGFPRCTISEEAKRFANEFGDVPAFDFRVDWYPLSEGSGVISLGAGMQCKIFPEEKITLAPTFVRLALNICQNAIKFGGSLGHHDDASTLRKRMRLYMACYRGLRARHPDIVFDEEFDRWMLTTKKATLDKYVRTFKFEPPAKPDPIDLE
jgi:hypothetical protein